MSYTRGPASLIAHAVGTYTNPVSATTSPSSSGVYPTADLAIYVPLVLTQRVVVRKLYVANGSAVSGNFDIGVYDASGTRLVSTGSTAQSGTTSEQVVDVTDTTVGPGLVYMAVTLDNTTGAMQRDSDAAPTAAAYGVLAEQLGAGGTLPATATWVVDQTLAYVPNIGMLLTTVVS